LRIPDLQSVPVDYVVIWTQRFSGFNRRFEGLECLHGVAVVGGDVERGMQTIPIIIHPRRCYTHLNPLASPGPSPG
jgi:hypothetical protein